MQRVEHERDPWSGHVSLPGGRSSAEDLDLLATAIRETREEVDVDLRESARLLGQLEARQAMSRGKPHDMDVTPFIFRLEREVEPTPMEEAKALFWLPLEQARNGAFEHEHQFQRGDQIHRTDAWKFEDYVVWGMTYRILDNLLSVCHAK
ncbi:MAG: 8-oxo-dGTP pyrophosphatase MutT (NUDIX family) [Planctomycetota bacterium]|jgi:8-oxo-dGTP pyrophosphatase MutT (NUDIX family)